MLKKHLMIPLFIIFITGCNFLQPDYLNTITATQLHELMQQQDIFLVDVHTPQQKHIKGTDLFMPYNEVEKFQDKLPKDKNTAIYLYCEGEPMGNAAARTLYDLGYTNLYNLQGGSNAWHKSGFEFE